MKARFSAAELKDAAETLVIGLARDGSADAFSELVRRRQEPVRRFMRYLSGHADLGDDLAQQVFIKTWRSIRQLKSPAAFPSWLKRIMLTTWLEHARRRQPDIAPDQDSTEQPGRADAQTERSDLEYALARLPVPMRVCVVLAYHEGMTHAEIAEQIEMPLGTVKSNVTRGAARLRELLAGYESVGGGA